MNKNAAKSTVASKSARRSGAVTSSPVHAALEAAGLAVTGSHAIPAREARYAKAPPRLAPRVRKQLSALYPKGLFLHQSMAIDALLDGRNVTIATPTSSGKTAVGAAYAMHLQASNSGRHRVVAFFPAKALAHDQKRKWEELAGDSGLTVGVLDGSVPLGARETILRDCDVVLATPDVFHAWVMSNVGRECQDTFLDELALVILDEAHSYDGVFGTNMAYFTRRIAAVAPGVQFFLSTATLADTASFARALTGRDALVVGPDCDGAEAPPKHIVVASPKASRRNARVALVREVVRGSLGRFLVFADSRRVVETLVAKVLDQLNDDDADEQETGSEEHALERARTLGVLPYRAGFEETDRKAIQEALTTGTLRGVVTTSALELGIDIGDISCVVLLGPPPSMKSFWQRMGRAGRRNEPGLAIILDNEQVVDRAGGLDAWLARPIEPSHLYLDNVFIQYQNVLCAASEAQARGTHVVSMEAYESLPPAFRDHLANELRPLRSVPEALFALKTRGDNPQRQFPLRSAGERSFRVLEERSNSPRGELTHAQLLREAYPGARWFYMAQGHQVRHVDEKNGVCKVVRAKGPMTSPITQSMVFPSYATPVFAHAASAAGYLVEAAVQVSERVLGFVEHRGSVREEHRYENGSPFRERELTRRIQTTGVLWWNDRSIATSERIAERIRCVFSREFGIREADLGVGTFSATISPAGAPGTYRGVCIYDATSGSLRLTARLMDQFEAIVELARQDALAESAESDLAELEQLLLEIRAYARTTATPAPNADEPKEHEDGTIDVIAPGQRGLYVRGSMEEEVIVRGVRFTAQGLMYVVEPPTSDSKRFIPIAFVRPFAGETTFRRFDRNIGDFLPVAA
jgi:DEAD/DEAH box helicase domain-containing protein